MALREDMVLKQVVEVPTPAVTRVKVYKHLGSNVQPCCFPGKAQFGISTIPLVRTSPGLVHKSRKIGCEKDNIGGGCFRGGHGVPLE